MIHSIIKAINKIQPFISKANSDNVFAIAGQSAFFIVLSAFPLTMFLASILQNLHIPFKYVEDSLNSLFSQQVVDYISSFMNDVYNNSVGISFITLIVTLWSAAKGIQAITNGLNRIYNAYENRNWLFLRIRAMIYTVVLFAILIATLLVVVLGTTIKEWISSVIYIPYMFTVVYHLRFLIIFVYLIVLFALLYRNFPNISRSQHKEYGIKYQLPGAFLCALSWVLLSFGISIYVNDFNGFSIYGSLTRLAVIMVWLYFCMICLMLGAEINYFYHEQIKAFEFKALKKRIKNIKSKNKK